MLFVRDLLAGQSVRRAAGAPEAPAVSVILPTWRRFQSGLLRRAVESVLSQSFRDLELIAVDDGSTDGSREYLLEVQREDPRLVYVRHELNCGLPALRVNEGIELARGRHLAFQFDDDEWVEGALESLMEAAVRCPEPSVVFGAAVCTFPDGRTETLPAVAVNLLTLSYSNRIANNSVLLHRELIDRHGLYDPHVGMRRLCDWDLWQRLVETAPFVDSGCTVSRVRVAADPSAIGVAAPIDFPLFRYLHAIPRDHLLTPARWRDYEVDGLRVGEVEVIRGFRERLERGQVLPYRRRMAHAFPHLGAAGGSAPAPAVRSVLYTMDAYYGSIDLCLGHYDLPSWRRGIAKAHYQPLAHIGPNWGRDVDFVLILRAVTGPGPRVVGEALAARIPVAFYLDDDFLNLHEYGPPFDFIAPGTPARELLVAQIEQADAVWSTSPWITQTLQAHTPRVVPHNGSIPEEWLPETLRARKQDGPVRIGYVGNAYRIEEFRQLWDALQRISREHGEGIELDFWGLDVSELPPLDSPVSQRPYTQSYRQFIDRLREARFDILLTPLLEHPRPRLAKAPSKYYQTAVAGSLGIFSDVPQYAMLPHGVSCLKAANDAESWYGALKEALTMPAARFDALRRAMIEHVRLEYTERAQLHLHEAAIRATEFHSATRARRGEDGRPRVAFAPGLETLREVAREYGVEPVDPGGDVPRVEAPGPAVVPRSLFERGLLRVLAGGEGRTVLFLGSPTLAAIDAIGLLRDRGIDVRLEIRGAGDPAETVRCRRRIHESGLQGTVRILRPVGDFWSGADLLLDLGGDGWREALAAGVVVVSNSGRDLADGITAVLFEGEGPEEIAAAIQRGIEERDRIVPHAYRFARGEFHPQRAASEMFALLAQERTTEEVRPPQPVDWHPSRRERLRHAADQLGLYRPASRLLWSRRRKRVLVTYENAIASVFLYWEHALPHLQEATGRGWLLRPAAEVNPNDLYTYHAVISVRGTSRKSLEILQAARRFGALTVYDTDDDLLRIEQAISDPDNPWRRTFGAARPEIEALLRLADVVKVYGDSAVPLFRPWNPNVVAIRPYQILDGDELPPFAPDRPEITVGFLGSFFKDEEFGPVTRAILRILDEGHPIRFEFLGFLPKALEDRPEVSHVAWRSSYPEYRRTLNALEWDLGLAPLRDLEFHRGKNNAKYREYAAAGIPGIFSDAEVYRGSIRHRETGLIVPQEDEGAWYGAILELARDAGLREAIRRNAFADLRANYRLEDYVAGVASLLGGRA